jgi:predicted ATPase
MLRGDARASLSIALSFIDFCRARRVEQFLGAGTAIAAWARARLEDRARGLSEYRETLTALSERGHRLYMPYYLGRLAELDLAEHRAEAALSALREAQALAQDTGQRVFDGFLERLRGEVLLAANRANAQAGEAAFLSAIEVSGRQGARSFALQAAVVLTKLYQSTGRPVEAHAVLAPALEGFSPTPEMPEIAEAQSLLAAIAAGAHGRHE